MRAGVLSIVTACVVLVAAPVSLAAKQPDLKVTHVVAPVTASPGDVISVRDTTKNAGQAKAGKSLTRYFLSANEKRDKHDLAIASRKVPALAPGKASKGSHGASIAPNQQLGTWFVIDCADAKKWIAESSEKNNCRTSSPLDIVAATAGTIEAVGPPDVYGAITTPVIFYASGIDPNPSGVEVFPSGNPGASTFIPVSGGNDKTIKVDIPPGLGAGPFDAVVHTDGKDSATLTDAFDISNSLTISPKLALPSVVSTGASTDVTIIRDTAAGPPANQQFENGARAYLAPHAGVAPTIDLHATFVDSDTLGATVPPALAVGQYDLVVVNPSGAVGVLPSAVSVLSAVPRIDGVSPTTLTTASGQVLTISGADFSGPLVSLTCRDAAGSPESPPSVAVGTNSATSIQATINASTLTAGSTCVVHEVNGDGGYADFGPVGFVSASLNPVALSASSAMSAARTDFALVAGPQSSTGSYLYAIGGDSSTNGTGALSSVEATAVDAFGNLTGWQSVSGSLPAPVELAGAARIGNFIYLLGGSDGTNRLNTAYRAQILQQADAPAIASVAPTFEGTDQAPAAGAYTYRVAATFPGNDTSNPGGESLPSSPSTVYLPQNAGATVSWNAVSGANGYSVYRSGANAGPGVDLIAQIGSGATTSYHDDGSAPISGQSPTEPGALGHWRQLANLGATRAAPAVAAAPDPADTTKRYLYAIGGRDSSTTVTNTYEYLGITLGGGGSQAVASSFTAGANTLGTARWRAPGVTVTNAEASSVTAPNAYVYTVRGETAAGATVPSTEVGLVAAGGDLGTLNSQAATGGSRGPVVAVNGHLLQFGGGSAGVASNSIRESTITAPPTLGAWNAAGPSLSTLRTGAAATQYGPISFVAGGIDAGPAVLTSVERFVG